MSGYDINRKAKLMFPDGAPSDLFSVIEVIHKSVMSRSELVFAALFSRIKRSILSAKEQIIFVSDPWLTSYGRKLWKSSKLRP